MHTREEQMAAFGRLLDVLDELREKCPWDRKQTNESLRPNTIEETYELCDALLSGDSHEECKELGDVLLHLCFYARIASEKNEFDIADVCLQLTDKLIFRHPHIYHPSQIGAQHPRPLPYGEDEASREQAAAAQTADAVLQNWERIKQREKDGNRTVLSGVPQALPSLIKAFRMQEKAANVGFDWRERTDVWDKVEEEIGELRTEFEQNDRGHAEEELGDVLFAIVNAARLYKLNPDTALEKTCRKFRRRFDYIEQAAKAAGRRLDEMTLEEMDALWDECKQKEN